MKGLFDCLRNKVYREDEDILKQIAANAAMDDTEIEAFEADDEDDEDELFDFAGLDLNDIDDADIERVTNEFNMDEGNRAACRIKTIDIKEDAEIYDEGFMKNVKDTRLAKRDKKDAIKAAKRERNDGIDAVAKSYDDRYKDLERRKRKLNRDMDDLDYEYENEEDPHWEKYKKDKRAAKDAYKARKREIWGRKEDAEEWELDEDSVEFQPETRLNKKVSQDPDGREFVGAGDGSGHDMRSESFNLMMEEVMDQIDMLDEEAEEGKKKNRYSAGRMIGRGAAGGAAASLGASAAAVHGVLKKDKAARASLSKMGIDPENLSGVMNRKDTVKANMKAMGKETLKGAAIGAAAGAAMYGGKKAYDKIKAKRAAKAREVAVEEGVSLEEALDFVLECEEDLINEGFDIFEIYGEDNVELQPETRLNKKVSADDDMREFVGAGDGSGHDMRSEDVYEMYDEGGRPASQKKPPQFRDQNARNMKKQQLLQQAKAKQASDLGKQIGTERLNKGHEFLQGEYAKQKRAQLNKGHADLQRQFGEKRAKEAFDRLDSQNAAKAAHAAKSPIDNPMGDNKISLKANKKPINWKKGAAIAGGVAAAGAAAYGGKKLYDHIKAKRAAKAKEVAVEEGISLEEALDFVLECENDLLSEGYDIVDIYFEDYEIYDEDLYDEDNVEFQPETRLVKKVSTDDDMREFVGASKGAQDNLKTEAAILAYEEGISLEEAMAWLLEDEEYDEDAVDDAIAKLGKDGNNNGVFPNRLDLQDEVYDEDVFNEGRGKDAAMLAAGIGIPAAMAAGGAYLGHKAGKKIFKGKAKPVEEACGDADECAPKRQHQAPVGDVDKVSVDGVDTDDELMLGVEAVIQEIEESLNNFEE